MKIKFYSLYNFLRWFMTRGVERKKRRPVVIWGIFRWYRIKYVNFGISHFSISTGRQRVASGLTYVRRRYQTRISNFVPVSCVASSLACSFWYTVTQRILFHVISFAKRISRMSIPFNTREYLSKYPNDPTLAYF